jgi:hypothetical protein
MYLCDYFSSYSEGFDRIADVLNKYPESKIVYTMKGDHLNSCLGIRTNPNYNSFQLNEFPGNCSSLILHDIQSMHSSYEDGNKSFMEAIEFSLDIASSLSYGALFVTGTSGNMRETLLARGFEEILGGLFNPHSQRENFFLVKRIEYD